MSNSIVQVRDVHFSWDGKRDIYAGVDLDIPEGKITAIMGPSSTGKTTMLRLIGGQLKPNQGSVEVFGEEIPKLSSPK